MTIRLQQCGADWQMSPADYRNTKLLTFFSKLVMALVMGVVVVIVMLIG